MKNFKAFMLGIFALLVATVAFSPPATADTPTSFDVEHAVYANDCHVEQGIVFQAQPEVKTTVTSTESTCWLYSDYAGIHRSGIKMPSYAPDYVKYIRFISIDESTELYSVNSQFLNLPSKSNQTAVGRFSKRC